MEGVKYYLHDHFFFKDNKQLRASFRPWLRWLPAPILWRIAKWMYHR